MLKILYILLFKQIVFFFKNHKQTVIEIEGCVILKPELKSVDLQTQKKFFWSYFLEA